MHHLLFGVYALTSFTCFLVNLGGRSHLFCVMSGGVFSLSFVGYRGEQGTWSDRARIIPFTKYTRLGHDRLVNYLGLAGPFV